MKSDELAVSENKMLFRDYFKYLFLPSYHTKVKNRTYEKRLKTILKHFPYFYKLVVFDTEPIHLSKWQEKRKRKVQYNTKK